MIHYTPPTATLTGFPPVPSQLANDKDAMCHVLLDHVAEFDAIVCAGDMHGIALASIASAYLWKPLMIVCTGNHDCVVSHIVMIGDIHPEMRFLYVDDMFAFGASKNHVFTYMNQSTHSNIVATYEHSTREYSNEVA